MYQVLDVTPELGCYPERLEAIIGIAEETAIGLRLSTRKNNVRQSVDFVNGMMFAGLLIEKNTPADEAEHHTFRSLFGEVYPSLLDRFRSGGSAATLAELATHEVGVVDQSPTDMLVLVGVSAQGVITEIGQEYGLSRRDMMYVAAFTIAACVYANSLPSDIDETMRQVSLAIEAKTKVWDDIIPSDDEWMDEED